MIRRLFISLLFLGLTSVCFGRPSGRGFEILSNIGPTNESTNANVEIAAGGTGNENCLTSLTANATSAFILRVIDGLVAGTTIYQLRGVANTPLLQLWGIDGALCGSSNSGFVIKVTGNAADKPHTAQKNFQGFVK